MRCPARAERTRCRARRARAGARRIGRVRTYSHALLTLAATRRLAPSDPGAAAWAAAGATLPDAPVTAAAVWLFARWRRFTRRGLCEEACAKGYFGGPDAALHSALPAGVLLALWLTTGPRGRRRCGKLLAFLLGWAGHVLADALTHAQDARPILWPLSRRCFRGPVSYWDRSHHARLFAATEHGALVLVAARALRRRPRASD